MLLEAHETLHGIAVVNGELLFTETDHVRAVPLAAAQRTRVSAAARVVADLSGIGRDRWTHTLDYRNSTGELFVSTGQPYGASDCRASKVGAVLRIGENMPPDGELVSIQLVTIALFFLSHPSSLPSPPPSLSIL